MGLFVLSPIELVLESRVDGWFGLRGYGRTIMHHVIHCFKNFMYFGGENEVKHHGGIRILRTKVRIDGCCVRTFRMVVRIFRMGLCRTSDLVMYPETPDLGPDSPGGESGYSGCESV